MNKPIRVILVAPFPPPYGGIANWSLLLKKYHNNHLNEFDLEVINTATNKRITEGRTIFNRIFIGGFKMIKLLLEMFKTIRKFQPTVTHITTSGSLALIRDYFLIRIAKNYKISIVTHLHYGRIPELNLKKNWEWKLLIKVLNKTDKIICIDDLTYLSLKKIYGSNKVFKILNPIDIEEIDKVNKKDVKKENVILFIGWCVNTKGIEELLLAWNRITAKYKDWKLKIVGPYKEDYFKFLKKMYNIEYVEFLGEKTHRDTLEELKKSSIFILPSYTEGCPNVILEAMSLGKAIISTNVGAIPEMLQEESGIIVSPKNVEELENSIDLLLKNEELQKKIGRNSFIRVRNNYTLDVIMKKYQVLWRS